MEPLPRHPLATLRRYRGEYAAHAHGFVQVLCAAEGRLQLEVEGRNFVVEPGRGLVVPPGAAHAYLADRDAAVWVVDTPPAAGLDRVRAFARAGRVPTSAGFDAVACLDALVAAPRALARRRLDLGALDRTLESALHEDWTTARLAAACHFSVPRFHARLLEATGLTPQAYLRQRRLDRAGGLLAAGLTLDAAALQLGYRSGSALAFALRRERGLGARGLRRR